MGTTRRQLLIGAYKLFDLLVMLLAFGVASLAVLSHTQGISFDEFFAMRVKVENFALFAGLLGAWHLIFLSFGLYQSRRFVPLHTEILDSCKATLLGTTVIAVAAALFRVTLVSPFFLLVFGLTATSATLVSRLSLRLLLGYVRARGHNQRNVLVAGTNSRAVAFVDMLRHRPELGYHVVGFVDDEWSGRVDGHLPRPIVCNLRGFASFVRSQVIDEVVMALPIRSFYSQASKIVAVCETQGILVRFVSSLFDCQSAHATADDVEGHPLVTLNPAPLQEGWPAVVKRVMDVLVSAAAITVLAPVFVVAALLIKFHSPGPVFFVQRRLGLNKRTFLLFKFRTMVPDAERRIKDLLQRNEMGGPVFKIKDDPRITPVGKFLRKTSIDELPQLFNVLKGDMSLVGPRPLPVRDYEGFDQDWHRRRFSVRPGITCLWQISGRNSITFERWMEMDMEYIDNWSLWLDLKILAGTVPAVLRGTGAA